MTHKQQQQLLERVIYEEAQEIARQRNWSVKALHLVLCGRGLKRVETLEKLKRRLS
jgi:hypothetical protein